METKPEQMHCMLFSPCYFFHLPEIDFVSVAGQSDHALLFINHNASHAFAVPVVEIGTHTHKRKQIARTHTEKPYTQTQKEGPRCEKKSYSTPYINSGLDKHNTHKRVTPWK